MQKINLIAQSVLKLSHRENADDNDNDNDDDNDDDDTHPGWIIVRVGRYSVADKKERMEKVKDNVEPILIPIRSRLKAWLLR